ncbi:hypothetical protein ACFLS1_06105 [Verrucomicrobiota bacterium]
MKHETYLPRSCPRAYHWGNLKLATLLLTTFLQLGMVFLQAQEESILNKLDVDVHGFLDARAGTRIQDDSNEKSTSMGEARFQLSLERIGDLSTVQIRADFIHDDIPGKKTLNIDEGTGAVDLREASVLFSPAMFADIKFGRQILTWGTGDLLFINDMFPKDWQSFFTGRDEEYLKAPSDAIMVSLFPAFANIDIAYVPRFDSDRYISGDRISYWNPMIGSLAGRNAVIDPDKPDEWFDDDEVSLRLSRNILRYEVAAYGYIGFWKNPVGMDPLVMNAFFPELSVYGASIQGPLGDALMKLEAGYYDSSEDRSGDEPFIPNSETRILVGYEREFFRNFSVGIQHYVEFMHNYNDYKNSLLTDQAARDEDRHVTTLRLVQSILNQNLRLSLFVYYSFSDKDAYLRPSINYKVTDAWRLTVGGNIFEGKENHTFFGQFEKNSNIYAGARYSF